MRNYNGARGLLFPPMRAYTMQSRMLLPAALLSLALLSACATPGKSGTSGSSAPVPNVNLAGFPPEYRKAYGDGCAHARNGGSVSQAPVFPQGAQQAAQGWRDGFDYCKARPR
jgi:hypothetical protein